MITQHDNNGELSYFKSALLFYLKESHPHMAGNKVLKFTGGCNGNLKAIPKLVEGLTVAQVEEKIGGIKCGFKNTSCGDQLAKACREAYEAQK